MAKGSEFSKHLKSKLLDPEFAAEYIVSAIEENDPDFLNQALADVVKAHGITDIADASGLARQAIYAMTSEEGNPTLQSINKLLNAVGLEIAVRPKQSAS